ncbi:uncharacterized protein A4U43_C03F23130 [Asparagus officinalis]|uniref:Uncharacterized protein n=1 Tax=Asparagus officinalis TaxID=4686 RepID=A0A5P1FE69_ASPOF|nr:uncharacterized protein A4U43_C03F23130 [Asparagus officinalis]
MGYCWRWCKFSLTLISSSRNHTSRLMAAANDVFHVTDQLGNKLTDSALIQYIQQSLVPERESGSSSGRRATEVMTCLGKMVGPGTWLRSTPCLEATATDQRGSLRDISRDRRA